MTLKEARKMSGMSMQELGKAVGVTAVTICRYEHGSRTPDARTAKRIADVLGLVWYELMDNKEQKVW